MSALARLVWERSNGERVEFTLDGEAHEVGRDEDVAIRVDEPLVSRRHARVERRGEGWVVVDLGSRCDCSSEESSSAYRTRGRCPRSAQGSTSSG